MEQLRQKRFTVNGYVGLNHWNRRQYPV